MEIVIGYMIRDYYEDLVIVRTVNSVPIMAIELKLTLHLLIERVNRNSLIEMFIYAYYIMRTHNLTKIMSVLSDGCFWHCFVCQLGANTEQYCLDFKIYKNLNLLIMLNNIIKI